MAEPTKRIEDEYFARQDFEKKQKLKHALHEKMKKEEKDRLKNLHYMRCPKCGMELIEIDFKAIKVDRCSECDGVWLDTGELQTILDIEKAEGSASRVLKLFRRTKK